MRSLVVILLAGLVSGCSLNVLPNPTTEVVEPSTPAPVAGAKTSLLETSKREAIAGTKSIVTDVLLGSKVSSQVDPTVNCIQVVKLQSANEIVVDFSDEACPPPPGLAAPESLQLTLTFQQEDPTDFQLIDGTTTIGIASGDPTTQAVTLTDLCTSDFAARCSLVMDSKELVDINLF